MDAPFGNKLVDEIKSILSKFEPISLDRLVVLLSFS